MSEVQATEHPYVVIDVEMGVPYIRGTRVAIHLVANYFRRNAAIEEIEHNHPELSLAAIHDAISYYLDHREEIDNGAIAKLIEESQRVKARNDAEGTWVSSAEVRERMAKRGVLVG